LAITLTQGTVEYLLFDWTDTLGSLTTLVGAGGQYDVKDTQPTVHSYYTGQSGTVNGATPMRLYCLIDTTTSPGGSPSAGGAWLPGDYKIWVKLTSPPGSERPRVGPFTFTVVL
jgi:hypothetical protein